jgi:hypothetical protein
VAVRPEPDFRAYYEDLRAQGKTKMQALAAVMRKLMDDIYSMFPHQLSFYGMGQQFVLAETGPNGSFR